MKWKDEEKGKGEMGKEGKMFDIPEVLKVEGDNKDEEDRILEEKRMESDE